MNLLPLSATTLCIDVDSTALNHESLTGYVQTVCETADEAIRDEAVKEIDRITELGMNNQIGFSESLALRAAVIRQLGATSDHAKEYVTMLRNKLLANPTSVLTPSFARQADWIRANKDRIYFLSGGMEEIVAPLLTTAFDIDPAHIKTNAMLFNADTCFEAFDTTRLLYRDDGKAAQIRQLRTEGVAGRVVMLGDGGNDLNAKQPGGADIFVAFTEIKARNWEGVEGVDHVANNLREAIHYINRIEN